MPARPAQDCPYPRRRRIGKSCRFSIPPFAPDSGTRGCTNEMSIRGVVSTNVSQEHSMYVIREILNCRPGKVRPMIEKFRAISKAIDENGGEPLRLLTDVTGEPFWTLIAEAKVERIDDFFVLEQKLMAMDSLREVMADYHDLVESGRREVYRIES
jgi:hypothetical protein